MPRVAEQYPWERPLGASVIDDALVEFRAWAPAAQRVAVRVRGADHELADEGFGVRSARVAASAGDDYWPCSTAAPARPRLALAARRAERALGRRGPRHLRLDRRGFRAAARRDLVFYELHVGTFTPRGPSTPPRPAPALVELGVTQSS